MDASGQEPLEQFVTTPAEQQTLNALREHGIYVRPVPQGKGSGDFIDVQLGHEGRAALRAIDSRDPQGHERSKAVVPASTRWEGKSHETFKADAAKALIKNTRDAYDKGQPHQLVYDARKTHARVPDFYQAMARLHGSGKPLPQSAMLLYRDTQGREQLKRWTNEQMQHLTVGLEKQRREALDRAEAQKALEQLRRSVVDELAVIDAKTKSALREANDFYLRLQARYSRLLDEKQRARTELESVSVSETMNHPDAAQERLVLQSGLEGLRSTCTEIAQRQASLRSDFMRIQSSLVASQRLQDLAAELLVPAHPALGATQLADVTHKELDFEQDVLVAANRLVNTVRSELAEATREAEFQLAALRDREQLRVAAFEHMRQEARDRAVVQRALEKLPLVRAESVALIDSKRKQLLVEEREIRNRLDAEWERLLHNKQQALANLQPAIERAKQNPAVFAQQRPMLEGGLEHLRNMCHEIAQSREVTRRQFGHIRSLLDTPLVFPELNDELLKQLWSSGMSFVARQRSEGREVSNIIFTKEAVFLAAERRLETATRELAEATQKAETQVKDFWTQPHLEVTTHDVRMITVFPKDNLVGKIRPVVNEWLSSKETRSGGLRIGFTVKGNWAGRNAESEIVAAMSAVISGLQLTTNQQGVILRPLPEHNPGPAVGF